MHATNAAQALREKALRLNEKARRKAQAKKDARPTLAHAPVMLAANVMRNNPWEAVGVENFATPALASTASWSGLGTLNALPRVYISNEARIAARPAKGSGDWGPDDASDREDADIDENESAQAGLRAHLANGAAYGPEVTRIVSAVYPSGVRRLIVAHGRLSAIHRAFPDDRTHMAWQNAGISRPKGSAWPAQMELFPLKLDA